MIAMSLQTLDIIISQSIANYFMNVKYSISLQVPAEKNAPFWPLLVVSSSEQNTLRETYPTHFFSQAKHAERDLSRSFVIRNKTCREEGGRLDDHVQEL